MTEDYIQVVQHLKNGNIAVFDIDWEQTHIGDEDDPLTTIAILPKMTIVEY